MKKTKLLLLAITLAAGYTLTAQVAINTTADPPHISAMLDVSSDTAGILIPRMTETQRNDISNPATGLMIYQTDETPGFYYYDGTSWGLIGSTVSGDFSNGGEIGSADRSLGNTDNFGLGFLTNNTSRIYIQNGGNVGIGTINPVVNLDIRSSSISLTSKILLGNSDRSTNLYLYSGNDTANPYISFKGGDALRFVRYDGGINELMRIQSDGRVGIGTDTPDESALLEVNSNSKGLLPPRMTTDQMVAISNPQEGLMVYNFDLKTICWFNGTRWAWDSEFNNCGLLEYEGKIYTTVVIGTQCWMQENLATTKYNNGTDIPLVTGDAAWAALTTPGYCWYDNDSATYAPVYGALYNWYTVNTANLCPSGWHIPTDEEWKTMEMYLGMSQAQADATGWRGTDEGGKLKETGTTHWISPNTGATNTSGFTALPGGYRGTYGSFGDLGYSGSWWSVTETNSNDAYTRYLSSNFDEVNRYIYNKDYGFSVRCLRD